MDRSTGSDSLESVLSPGKVAVTRPVFQLEDINQSFECNERQGKKWIKSIEPRKCLENVMPIFGWIREYSLREDLILDIISGCTVAIMHIPQGMAYALLANVPPVMGIYTAFFPVLVYFLFGTSRHNSMGTFAVVSIMVGKCVLANSNFHHGEEEDLNASANSLPTALEVVSALGFLIGIIQSVMYLCRLGLVASLLSDPLVSGFTTGAAVHVFTSQVKDLFGLTLPKLPGSFDIIYTYYEIFKNITNLNYVATALSAVTCLILIFNNEIVKPRVAKHTIFPIPMELILVVCGTLVSVYINLGPDHNLSVIGNIPTGFPVPTVPAFGLMGGLIKDAVVISIVSYSVSISMALIFSKKDNYEINLNQDLLAMGLGNMFGSFFKCIPFAASLSRSAIQHSVGGKTQIASLVSCGILVFILLWIGPLFEDLPKAVLASIIVVSLKGLLWQVKDFRTYWRSSKADGCIWLATFTSVVIIAIDIGLIIGICLSISFLVYNGLRPFACLLGQIPGSEIYLDISKYKKAEELDNIKIFQYVGCLNFTTQGSFKKTLYRMIKIENPVDKQSYPIDATKYVILDLTSVIHVDISGAKVLSGIVAEMKASLVDVLVVTLSSRTVEQLHIIESNMKTKLFKLFPTVHDAVSSVRSPHPNITIMYDPLTQY